MICLYRLVYILLTIKWLNGKKCSLELKIEPEHITILPIKWHLEHVYSIHRCVPVTTPQLTTSHTNLHPLAGAHIPTATQWGDSGSNSESAVRTFSFNAVPIAPSSRTRSSRTLDPATTEHAQWSCVTKQGICARLKRSSWPTTLERRVVLHDRKVSPSVLQFLSIKASPFGSQASTFHRTTTLMNWACGGCWGIPLFLWIW